MCEVIMLKEVLSKIETLAEAALYLADSDDERQLQTEIIRLIEDIAYRASLPIHEVTHG